MYFLWLSPEASKFTKNNIFEYTYQILGGNNIGPPNYEYHNYM